VIIVENHSIRSPF